MKEKKKKKKEIDTASAPILSPRKRRIFIGAAFLFPFICILLLEIGLRYFQYGGNLELFIEGPTGYGEYLRCNPNVARRYFSMQSNIPTPPKQLFLRKKPSNGYRIFVLGESSTAGFPYGNNASFPNVLERGLSNAFPEKRIEVINVAMAAINSYALLDMIDEVVQQSPDAVLIYTGHNEYYGALGVGSAQSLGNMRWLIKSYLKIQSIKVFLLLRDCIGWTKIQLSKIFYKGSEIDPSATLMERIVAEQTIPYGGSLYESGKIQFQENMNAILEKAIEKGVQIVLSELVSNMRDQEPFISLEDREGQSAKSVYTLARQLEANGNYENAREKYILAKDLDALRFRAPEEFNLILRELAKKYAVPIVPTMSFFEKETPSKIIGSSLILEHLHPNIQGYFLLAKAFYETMQNNRMISNKWPSNYIDQERNQGLTELDSVYSTLVIQQLKGSWPFQPKFLPNRFLQNFRPANRIEEIAFHVIQSTNYSLESGHMELGDYYEKQGNLDRAFLEYNALITSIPHEMEFYQKAATVLLEEKEYDRASKLLRKSLKYKENNFANKWIGQVALMKGELKEAISFLKKADLLDAQVVFNLSRAYYSDGQWSNGEVYFLRLQNMALRSDYLDYLKKIRSSSANKK
jgi:tetratricopeptide (TPR) repeat protein